MTLTDVANVLERLMPPIAALARLTRALAVVGAIAAGVLVWLLFRHGVDSAGDAIGRAALAFLAVAPPALLLFVTLALRELTRLPQRVRGLPRAVGAHATELERLARDVRDVRAARSRRLTAVWRVVRLQASARETLAIYAPIAALLSVPLLAGAVVAAALVPVEAVVALVLLVVLA